MNQVACWLSRSPGTFAAGLTGAAWFALSAVPQPASADTIVAFDLVSGSVLAGNSTNPPSAFCAPSSLCPSSPTYGLAVSEPLSGTVTLDLTTDTMSFDLTLTQNATFGGLTVDSGSSFIATNDSVTVKKSGTTYSVSPGTTTDTVLANLLLSSGFTETQSSPSMPGIECSATAASGSCSLTIGTPTSSGANSLLINGGGNSYNGVLSVSANLSAVPLPASVWLMLGGLGALLFMAFARIETAGFGRTPCAA
jgi:hypothetical protein